MNPFLPITGTVMSILIEIISFKFESLVNEGKFTYYFLNLVILNT